MSIEPKIFVALSLLFAAIFPLEASSQSTVPDLVGLTQTEATELIANEGFSVGGVSTASSEVVPAGVVISQNPSAGVSAAPGSSISLVVSSGPPPLSVPDVIGIEEAVAVAVIESAGLVVGDIIRVNDGTVPAGIVINQSPVADTIVMPGDSVSLTVSEGPLLVSVPPLFGLTQQQVVDALVAVGLQLGTVGTTSNAAVSAGQVFSYNPNTGQLPEGSSVSVLISSGPPSLTGVYPSHVLDSGEFGWGLSPMSIGRSGLIAGSGALAPFDDYLFVWEPGTGSTRSEKTINSTGPLNVHLLSDGSVVYREGFLNFTSLVRIRQTDGELLTLSTLDDYNSLVVDSRGQRFAGLTSPEDDFTPRRMFSGSPGRSLAVIDISDSCEVRAMSSLFVAGYCGFPNSIPFVWSEFGGFVIADNPPGIRGCRTTAVNARGDTTGDCFDSLGSSAQWIPFRWQQGSDVELINVPAGLSMRAVAINDSGDIAGNVQDLLGLETNKVFRFTAEGVLDIEGSATESSNAWSLTPQGYVLGVFSGASGVTGFVWSPEGDVEEFDGVNWRVRNEIGHAAGNDADGAVYWTPDSGIIRLRGLDNLIGTAVPAAINIGGSVVANQRGEHIVWQVFLDDDGDGILNGDDRCPLLAAASQSDIDLDGQGDDCDVDIDGDNVLNELDEFPTDGDEWQDSDGDGIGDNGDEYPFGRFIDVGLDFWAFSQIEALANSGLSGGCGGDRYCPEAPVTRAQMAVFLERGINGSDFQPPAATGEIFDDVAAGDFAAAFIEQLFRDGITSGCGNGNYCPQATVTRAQMAVFLLRSLYGSDYQPPPATGLFNDVPPGSFAAAWIEDLFAEGITAGCGNGDFCPNAPVTRAQMAVFLVRTFNL